MMRMIAAAAVAALVGTAAQDTASAQSRSWEWSGQNGATGSGTVVKNGDGTWTRTAIGTGAKGGAWAAERTCGRGEGAIGCKRTGSYTGPQGRTWEQKSGSVRTRWGGKRASVTTRPDGSTVRRGWRWRR